MSPTIKLNPGPRTLAKTMNNSMWGKFGQQENKTQVVEFVEPQPFYTFLDSDQHDIHYVSSLTEEWVEVHYKQKGHCETVSPNVNIFMAAFITCWARLRLYEAFELLDERVLYFDTDSIIFTHLSGQGQTSPPLGDYLGDFKNELESGDVIVEFCSGGPKNYGYQTRAGQPSARSVGSPLTFKVENNSTMRSCGTTPSPSWNNPWSPLELHASPNRTPLLETPRAMPSTRVRLKRTTG